MSTVHPKYTVHHENSSNIVILAPLHSDLFSDKPVKTTSLRFYNTGSLSVSLSNSSALFWTSKWTSNLSALDADLN